MPKYCKATLTIMKHLAHAIGDLEALDSFG